MSTGAARPAQPARAPGGRRRPGSRASAGLPIVAGPSAILAWNQPYRSNPCIPLPQTGVNPAVAAPAAPNWSAWTQITAGEAVAYTLVQMQVAATILTSNRIFIQLGVGAAGSESIIWENSDRTAIGGAGAQPIPGFFYKLPPYRLAASARLAFRIRQTTAAAGDVTLGLVIHAQADPLAGATAWDGDTYAAGSTSSLQLQTPAIAGSVNVTANATANLYGAWAQFIASAATRLRPIAICSGGAAVAAARTNHYQIGTGAAGSEVAHEIASVPGDGIFCVHHNHPFARPVDVVAGERVAIRMRSTLGGEIRPIALMYETVPV